MSFTQGLDFRAAAGFVTDPTNCDKEIATTANYPRTSAQGNTVGWEDAPTGVVDRVAYTGTQAKMAGLVFFNSVGANGNQYRIDLPATGSYKFRVAAGDASNPFGVEVDLYDTTTSLGSLVGNHTTSGADQFYDATDVQRTSHTDWDTNNALSTAKTFSTTICRFKMPVPGSINVLAHFWIESAGSSGSVGGGSDTLQAIKESGFAKVGAL